MATAIIRLSKDVSFGNGKNKKVFGRKGDPVEIENYGNVNDGMYMVQHKSSKEKLILKKEDL